MGSKLTNQFVGSPFAICPFALSPWPDKLSRAEPLADLRTIPSYGAIFFWQNIGPFRRIFWVLTVCAAVSAVLNFYTFYLLGELISHITQLTPARLFSFYLPLYVAAASGKELLDYLTRRYAEALPTAYSEYSLLRFYGAFLGVASKRLFGISKERLHSLVHRYIANVEGFLRDWFWGLSRRSVELVLVIGILYYQSPAVCLLNLAYMTCFLMVSFRLSRRFAPIAMDFSKASTASSALYTNFYLLLNSVKRLAQTAFFLGTLRDVSSERLRALDALRSFHARRWLIQLTLFNGLYVGTLFIGVYQVMEHALPLGFLVLIRYAFTQLWEILVYAIEYYVRLIAERQDAELLRQELQKAELGAPAASGLGSVTLKGFSELQLRDVELSFTSAQSGGEFHLSVPALKVVAGARVGIVGKSGSGKSTLLHILLNVLPYQGSFCVDGQELQGKDLLFEDISFISSYDPLFNLSLRSNILLGREVDPGRLRAVLDGVCLPLDAQDLERRVGDSAVNLSSGEAQRLRLARGLLQDAQLFIFDEPFNGIDGGTKKKILQFLEAYLYDKTVILVTHDESELGWVKQVYRMEDGVLLSPE